jgi:hypothetical protein
MLPTLFKLFGIRFLKLYSQKKLFIAIIATLN